MTPMVDDPLCRVQWVQADELRANHWNPNVVFTPELRLLERSILRQGWVQPILATRTGTIVDGFHRWRLAQDSAELRKRYRGKVPVVTLDVSDSEAMVLTVRMNRAKGQHVGLRMATLVTALKDAGMDPQEIARDLGATLEEVKLLLAGGVLKARDLKDAPYSEAWEPAPLKRARK